MKYCIYILILFISFSCKQEKENETKTKTENKIEVNVNKVDVNKDNRIEVPNSSRTINIGYAFVNAENGLNVRDENGKILGKLDNATRVKISDFTKDSIKVFDNNKWIWGRKAIIDYYYSNLDENGLGKVGYIKAFVFEKFLSDISKIRIYDSELCKLKKWNHNYTKFDVECLDSILSLKIISKEEYKKYDFLNNSQLSIVDSDEIIEEKNVLSLPTKDSIVHYRSVNDEEITEEYSFLGEIPSLNSYLISGSYYETSNYLLVSKISGKNIAVLEAFPDFSPNESYLISANYNPHMTGGNLQVIKIKNKEIIKFHSFEFKNWAISEEDNLKWISENEFIIKVKHINVFWGETHSYKNHQYLKITIL